MVLVHLSLIHQSSGRARCKCNSREIRRAQPLNFAPTGIIYFARVELVELRNVWRLSFIKSPLFRFVLFSDSLFKRPRRSEKS